MGRESTIVYHEVVKDAVKVAIGVPGTRSKPVVLAGGLVTARIGAGVNDYAVFIYGFEVICTRGDHEVHPFFNIPEAYINIRSRCGPPAQATIISDLGKIYAVLAFCPVVQGEDSLPIVEFPEKDMACYAHLATTLKGLDFCE